MRFMFLTCTCGEEYLLKDTTWGHAGKCSRCARVFRIPLPDAAGRISDRHCPSCGNTVAIGEAARAEVRCPWGQNLAVPHVVEVDGEQPRTKQLAEARRQVTRASAATSGSSPAKVPTNATLAPANPPPNTSSGTPPSLVPQGVNRVSPLAPSTDQAGAPHSQAVSKTAERDSTTTPPSCKQPSAIPPSVAAPSAAPPPLPADAILRAPGMTPPSLPATFTPPPLPADSALRAPGITPPSLPATFTPPPLPVAKASGAAQPNPLKSPPVPPQPGQAAGPQAALTSQVPPPLPSPSPSPTPTPPMVPLTPTPRPLSAEGEGPQDRPSYPWETPPEIIARAEAYEAAGRIQRVPCKVDEFLEGLIRPEVFRSIKAKAKQSVNLAELHVYPDLVGIVERPPALGCLTLVVAFLFPFLLPLLPLILGLSLIRWAVMLVLLAAFVAGLAVLLTPLGAILAIALLVAAAMIGNRLYESWARRNLDRIARRIRENPKSSYAVKQMYKRAGWVRWRTGIGRGQSGAEMTARFWQRGDVEQLIRVDVKSRFLLRNLLLIVMDNPHPHSLGWRGIGAILVFFRLFRPHRRIYVVDVEGGSGVADSAAHVASQALGLTVQRGQFSWFSLTVLDRGNSSRD